MICTAIRQALGFLFLTIALASTTTHAENRVREDVYHELQKADNLIQEEKFDDALAILIEASKLSDLSPYETAKVLHYVGYAAYRNGDTKLAITAFESLLKLPTLEPGLEEDALTLVAFLLAQDKRWNDALEIISRLLATYIVDNAEVYRLKASVHLELNQPEQMLEPALKAIEISKSKMEPPTPLMLTLLTYAYSHGPTRLTETSVVRPSADRDFSCDVPDLPGMTPTRTAIRDAQRYRNGSVDNLKPDSISDSIFNGCRDEEFLTRGFEKLIKMEQQTRGELTERVPIVGCLTGKEELKSLLELASHIRLTEPFKGPRGGMIGANTYGSNAISRCKANDAKPDDCRKLDEMLNDIRQTVVPMCAAFYRGHYSPQIEYLEARQEEIRLAALKAEQDRRAAADEARRKEQQRVAEQERREQAVQALRLTRTNLLTEWVSDESRRVIWGSERPLSGYVSAEGMIETLNKINEEYVEKTYNPIAEHSFSPSEKGQFEKTVDYEARIERERAIHSAELAELRRHQLGSRTKTLEEALTTLAGSPSVRELQYDADNETFSGVIKAPSGDIRIDFSLPFAIAKAEKMMSTLDGAPAWVVFRFSNNRLQPVGALAQSDGETIEIPLQQATWDFEFGRPTAQAYQATKERRREDERRAANARRKEHAKQYPYFAQISCTFNGTNVALIICLKADGEVAVDTSLGKEIVTMHSSGGISDHKIDLTQSYGLFAVSGSSAPAFGALKIEIFEQESYRLLDTIMLVGPSKVGVARN